MATITQEVSTIAITAPNIVITGRGKSARTSAYMSIAALSFIETGSRMESIVNLSVALGTAPSVGELSVARDEWVIGRVAAKLIGEEFPKGTNDDSGKLEFARKLVLDYAQPVKEGTKGRMPKGKSGRRSTIQHKAVRAAEEAWSQVLAELGMGKAQTQEERNGKKRAPSMAGSGKGKKTEAPSHEELIQPTAPVSSDDYVQFMQTQLQTLVSYDQKHAKKRPTTHSAFADALMALKQVANTAANDYAMRKAAALENAKK